MVWHMPRKVRCLQLAREVYRNFAPALERHFEDSILPLLRNNLVASEPPGLQLPSGPWTNNNCESINHILKQAIDWKAQPLTDLVDTLHGVVKSQYSEVQRSLFGVGDFELCPEFKHFAMSVATWSQSSEKKRSCHYSRFLHTMTPVKAKVLASTGGERHFVAPSNGGKKPGQVKRKKMAKTTTIKKGKMV